MCHAEKAPPSRRPALLLKFRASGANRTRLKRGDRVVHGSVELAEKLGRNDLCPCGSGRRFQTMLSVERAL